MHSNCFASDGRIAEAKQKEKKEVQTIYLCFAFGPVLQYTASLVYGVRACACLFSWACLAALSSFRKKMTDFSMS